MRGPDRTSGALFSYTDPEDRMPPRQPLRKIRQVANEAPANPDGVFRRLCIGFGIPLIAPERLIRVSLIQILLPSPVGAAADGTDAE